MLKCYTNLIIFFANIVTVRNNFILQCFKNFYNLLRESKFLTNIVTILIINILYLRFKSFYNRYIYST
jgi:hypothetical protein